MEQDKILYERSTVESGEGQTFQVVETHTGLVRYTWTSARSWEYVSDNTTFLEQDAIDSAWAILRHFGEVE